MPPTCTGPRPTARSSQRPLAGGANVTLSSGGSNPFFLAVDSTDVYWTDYGVSAVMKVPIGGGAITTLQSGVSYYGIAVHGSAVYLTTYGDGTVVKTPKAGGSVSTIASGQSWPSHVAVDATSVYWTTQGTTTDGTVMKATPN